MRNDSKSEEKRKIQIQLVACYIIFLAIVIFWHLLMREYRGDAVNYFSHGLDSETLVDLLKDRYETWSSRVLIEAILYILSQNVVVWKVCNIVVYALFAYSLLRVTDFKAPKLTLGLWIIYPVIEMSTAGWIATYMNYFWPLAMGTFALISLHKIYYGKKIRWIEWPVYLLAALFATNVEQVCVLFVCILTGFGIEYYVIQKSRRGLWFYILQWIITMGNLVFILLSPGNAERTWGETARQMHDFGILSIVDKGVLGVVVTMNELATDNLNFLLFVSMIFFISIINHHYVRREEDKVKKILIEICYSAPLVFTVALTILKNTSETYFSQIQSLFENIVKVDAANWINFKYYIPFIAYMLMIMAIMIALLNLFDDCKENFRLTALFVTGLLTRVILGFSPTLYASGMRTFIFLKHY